MSDTTTCCYNCPDRKYKCHSTCERYLELKKYIAQINEKKNKENDADDFLFAVSRNRVKLSERYKKKASR